MNKQIRMSTAVAVAVVAALASAFGPFAPQIFAQY